MVVLLVVPQAERDTHVEHQRHGHHHAKHHKKHHKKHHHAKHQRREEEEDDESFLETDGDDATAPQSAAWIDHGKVDRVFADLGARLDQITGQTKQTLQALQGEADAAAHPDTY